MKHKRKIKTLETRISKLEEQLQTNKIILTDPFNPNLKVVVSVSDGNFSIDKLTTKQNSETIFKDNK